MPYLDPKRRSVRQRFKRLQRFVDDGLYPIDPNNPTSDLRCYYCRKVTRRNSSFSRHETWCRPIARVPIKLLLENLNKEKLC